MSITKYLVLTASLLINFNIIAQELELPEEEKERFRKITVITVNNFQGYLRQIANANGNELIKSKRRSLISTALEDFINEGEAPENCEGAECGPVLMLVSSLHRARVDTFPIREYLYIISDSNSYDKVDITRAESCYVSRFQRCGSDDDGNPIYCAVATFYQDFCGYREGKAEAVYCDRTTKEMRVQLRVNSDNRWRVLLGDTSVLETKPLTDR